MGRKEVDLPVEVAEAAGITAGRAAQLLGITTDSLRRWLRDPETLLVRNADGLYTLASVIKERARRDAARVNKALAAGVAA